MGVHMEQNCAQILIQSLEKKQQVLDRIIEQNDTQERILKQDMFDMDAFEASIDEQNEMIKELDKLDRGFESFYERVREDIMNHKEKYHNEIAYMKELIQKTTDKVVAINAGSARNKTLAEKQFQAEKKKIQQSVSKTKVARNYYNSMNNLNQVAPQFYDSKK
ncbi:MAG: flagellar protein FliT [Lachnospiraceae bacterium]|nr:flagellar protein FliT [Lachnospiraceae bacterium]